MNAWRYRCPTCGETYPIEPGRYLCDSCAQAQREGQPLEGVLECVWEGHWSGAADSIPLPVEHGHFPSLPVGDTPLWAPERLRAELGMPELWLKDDTCNPSGSFKDRASYLVAAFARKHGIKEIALASTGNAASSMACIGAAAGLDITVFLPKAAPVAKRVQVLQYGAKLREVDGTYDVAFEQSLAYSKATGVLSRNTAYNPLTIEGKKTVSFEIARALGRAAGAESSGAPAWAAPDHVFVPTGDGVIIAGVIRGFEDLLKLGRIDRMPKIWAAQAEGSSAIARALRSGGFEARPSDTIADSISVDVPRNGAYTLRKLREHSGGAVVVSDPAIMEAQVRLSRSSGLFAEPSSACAFAGFLKARDEGSVGAGECVVVMLTGSGLKDVKSAARAVGTIV